MPNGGPVSNSARKVVSGSTLPSSPHIGQVFVKTGAAPGLYSASAEGVWTGPYGTGAGTVTSVSGTANQIDVATGTTTPVLSFPTNGIIANNISPGLLSTATAAGTTTLTVASKGIQVFTGSTTQTIVLPVVTTLPQLGFGFVIQNDSSGALTVNSSGGNLVQTMAAGTRAFFTCKLLTGTDAASWNVSYFAGGTIGGSSGSVDRGLLLANGTGGSTVQGSSTTLSSAGVFGFVNNQRQVFSPGSQRAGLNVGSVGTDPSIQSNGDIWYNTTAFQLRAIINGSVVNIGGGGTIGGSGTLNTLAKFTPDGTTVGNSRITDADDIVIGTQEDPNHPFIFLDFTNNNLEMGSGNLANGTLQLYGGNPNISLVLDSTPAITATALTESLAIDGVAHTVITTAATAIQFVTNGGTASMPSGQTGTVQLVGAANTGAILGIPINNTVLATATGTVYSSPGNDGTALSIATEGNVSFPVTRAGTIRNLFVRTGGTAKTNTPTTVITIRKNGVDTAVTLTMTQTVNTTTSDTAHSFTVVAGDLITVSFTTTGAAGISTSIAGVSFELD